MLLKISRKSLQSWVDLVRANKDKHRSHSPFPSFLFFAGARPASPNLPLYLLSTEARRPENSSRRGTERILFLVRNPKFWLDWSKSQQDLFLVRTIKFMFFSLLQLCQLIAGSSPAVLRKAWRGSDGESVPRCRDGVGASSGASLLLRFRLSWRCSTFYPHLLWSFYQHPWCLVGFVWQHTLLSTWFERLRELN